LAGYSIENRFSSSTVAANDLRFVHNRSQGTYHGIRAESCPLRRGVSGAFLARRQSELTLLFVECGSELRFDFQFQSHLALVLRLSAVRTRVEKVNAELVTLTYGTIVAQLCQDYDYDYIEVNTQLERMGYSIGMRLVEDFLARSGTGRCGSFRDTAEVISKVHSSVPSIPVTWE
jgi:hypothetical protein